MAGFADMPIIDDIVNNQLAFDIEGLTESLGEDHKLLKHIDDRPYLDMAEEYAPVQYLMGDIGREILLTLLLKKLPGASTFWGDDLLKVQSFKDDIIDYVLQEALTEVPKHIDMFTNE